MHSRIWQRSQSRRSPERFLATILFTDIVGSTDLAVRLGWYDQAHFANDFRAMLGCSPGEYAQRYS